MGSIFVSGVQVYDCIFCESEIGYAYIIQNPRFYASRHQFLFSIDLIIMALGSISLLGVQVYDCIFCQSEKGYAGYHNNGYAPCYNEKPHLLNINNIYSAFIMIDT